VISLKRGAGRVQLQAAPWRAISGLHETRCHHSGPGGRRAAICPNQRNLVGGFHLGVEQGFWPSPLAGCKAATSGGAMSIEDMLKNFAPIPNKPCDAPAFLIPGLPISMAAMNMMYGLGLGALALRLARQGARA